MKEKCPWHTNRPKHRLSSWAVHFSADILECDVNPCTADEVCVNEPHSHECLDLCAGVPGYVWDQVNYVCAGQCSFQCEINQTLQLAHTHLFLVCVKLSRNAGELARGQYVFIKIQTWTSVQRTTAGASRPASTRWAISTVNVTASPNSLRTLSPARVSQSVDCKGVVSCQTK